MPLGTRYEGARMSGRRKVRVDDAAGWVFNRMADVYAARPAYPAALVDALAALTRGPGAHVLDVGAGVGHLSLPLARRGFAVTALEPAQAMLGELEKNAAREGLAVRTLHAAAENMPIASESVELTVIADALHFLDAALTGREVARVLTKTGCLAVVQCELGDTPFMRRLVALMEESAPRRPRAVQSSTVQVAALAGVAFGAAQRFRDETPLDHATLERIVRSISYIGPAMNPQRFEVFRRRLRELSEAPVWARSFSLFSGTRRG